MKQLDLTILNKTGLHARPAREFVNVAKQFKSKIKVQHGKKKVNAKSLISVLTLGVKSGGTISLEADGEDEALALEALSTAVSTGLGEGTDHLESAPTKAPKVSNGQQATNGSSQPAATPVAPAVATPKNVIQGVAAAPGIAIGPVFQLRKETVSVASGFSNVATETERLKTAVSQAQNDIKQLRDKMAAQAVAEAAIFDVHLDLLADPDLLEIVHEAIAAENNAAQAWQNSITTRAQVIAGLDDPLLAERATDLHDVGRRVLQILAGEKEKGIQFPDHPVILIAHDLTPSDTANLDKDKVLGFCTEVGGATAHAAIIARALGLPAVVGAGERVMNLAAETAVILDGTLGTLTVKPDEATLAKAKEVQEKTAQRQKAAAAAANDPAITKDGQHVEVAANVGGVAEAEQAFAAGAEGIGLLRTEFLFLERTEAPTEDEQFAVYRDVVKAMNNQPVIIRTLDIGGDKPLPYINVPEEENPFLGERGIRLCLNRPELLRQQLRAILRAAAFGKIRIMFPMVSGLSEWRKARAMVNEVKAELGTDANVELGIMVEIPSAALMADLFAAEIDFFSVGTNDLTQYTLAMDRNHPVMSKQADGLNPAVLRLIAQTCRAAKAAGKWVGVCGELGSDPQAVPILLGLGVKELSVSTPAVATTKAQIRELNMADAQSLAQKALACETAAAVRALS
ncbi:MAG: phosphoenolpyruvate--protein phosphotransferase [Chloroflexota bacterium]